MPKPICCYVQALLTTKNGNVESEENDNDNKSSSNIIHASEVPLFAN